MAEFVRADGVPIYIQIRESLRADITGGTLKRGEQLPSENELAAKYSVSRMTIRQSIEELVDEGLLYRRHGIGTFVAFPHLQRDHTRLTNFFDKAESEGVKVQVKLLSLDVIPAAPRVAEALDLPEGSQVIRVKTLRYADGEPVCKTPVKVSVVAKEKACKGSFAAAEFNGLSGFRFVAHDSEHTLLDINQNRVGPFAAGDPNTGGGNVANTADSGDPHRGRGFAEDFQDEFDSFLKFRILIRCFVEGRFELSPQADSCGHRLAGKISHLGNRNGSGFLELAVTLIQNNGL